MHPRPSKRAFLIGGAMLSFRTLGLWKTSSQRSVLSLCALPMSRESNRRWQLNNPEKVRASQRKYLENNREKAYAATRRYRERNPTYEADLHLRSSYGITLQQYDDWVKAHGGVCAICLRPPQPVGRKKEAKLVVDHDHLTNKLRALLCSHCNSMLGLARENVEVLRRAIAYLEHFRRAS